MSTYTLGKASRTKNNLFPSVFREHKMVHRNQNGMSYRTLVRTDTGNQSNLTCARGIMCLGILHLETVIGSSNSFCDEENLFR